VATFKAAYGKMLYTTSPVIEHFPEAASQTFEAGDLVFTNAGYIEECGADPASILGLVMEDGHDAGAGDYQVPVLVFTEATFIEMCVYHSDPGANLIEDTDLRTLYGLVASNHKWLVDKTEVVNTRVKVQQFKDPIGTVSGVVLVTVIPTVREFA